MTVHVAVYLFNPSDEEALRHRALSVLPKGFQVPTARNQRRRASFYAGRAALGALMEELALPYLVLPHREGFLEVVTRELNPVSGWFANISHTEAGGSSPGQSFASVTDSSAMAVAAIADAPIGIDVEQRNRDVSKVLERICHPEEWRGYWLSIGNEKIPSALPLWCAKEACSKALGLGIKFGLDRIKVGLTDGACHPIVTSLRGPFSLLEPTVTFEIQGSYLLAVCSERSRLESPLQKFIVR